MRPSALVLTALIACALAGCDTPLEAPFDTTGLYEGTWQLLDVQEKQQPDPCPITLELTQDVGAALPQNLRTNGEVTLDFTCFELARILEQLGLLEILPLEVSGVVDLEGNLILASPDLLATCPEGEICTRVVLTGVGSDENDDGFMDVYNGTWAVTLVVGNTPYPIAGNFSLEAQQ